jgi:hypothetical protein
VGLAHRLHQISPAKLPNRRHSIEIEEFADAFLPGRLAVPRVAVSVVITTSIVLKPAAFVVAVAFRGVAAVILEPGGVDLIAPPVAIPGTIIVIIVVTLKALAGIAAAIILVSAVVGIVGAVAIFAADHVRNPAKQRSPGGGSLLLVAFEDLKDFVEHWWSSFWARPETTRPGHPNSDKPGSDRTPSMSSMLAFLTGAVAY